MVFARFFFDSYLRCSRRAPILASTLAPRCVSSFLRASGMFLAPLHRCSTLVKPPLVDDLVDSFDSMCLHLSLSPSARVTSPAVPARLPPRQKLLPRPVPTPPTPTLATRPSPSLPPPATALALLQPAQTALAADLASRRLQEQYHDARLASPRKTLTSTARAASTAAALRLQTPSSTFPAFSLAVSQYVAEHSTAPSTVAIYTTMWKQWTNYCETRGHVTALPAPLPVLADFLVSSALRDEQAKLSFSNTKTSPRRHQLFSSAQRIRESLQPSHDPKCQIRCSSPLGTTQHVQVRHHTRPYRNHGAPLR